jgi:hypothetical protein
MFFSFYLTLRREIDRRKNAELWIVRGTIFKRRRSNFFLALKVPKKCPLFLLVEEHMKEGKVLGSE